MTTSPPSNDARAIEELRSKLAGRLTIAGHHYEQEDTIRHCDFRCHSLELARRGPGIASDSTPFSPSSVRTGVSSSSERASNR